MKKKLGYISLFFCMWAAFWITVLSEQFLSPWGWVVYTIGGIIGIVHQYREKDYSTLAMYIVWVILDIIAIVRLLL